MSCVGGVCHYDIYVLIYVTRGGGRKRNGGGERGERGQSIRRLLTRRMLRGYHTKIACIKNVGSRCRLTYTSMDTQQTHTGWWRPIGRVLRRRFLSTKEPLIIAFFCGKWRGKIRRSMHLHHPVLAGCIWILYENMSQIFQTCLLHNILCGNEEHAPQAHQVSFAKNPYKNRACLQKKTQQFRSLLIVAIPHKRQHDKKNYT